MPLARHDDCASSRRPSLASTSVVAGSAASRRLLQPPGPPPWCHNCGKPCDSHLARYCSTCGGLVLQAGQSGSGPPGRPLRGGPLGMFAQLLADGLAVPCSVAWEADIRTNGLRFDGPKALRAGTDGSCIGVYPAHAGAGHLEDFERERRLYGNLWGEYCLQCKKCVLYARHLHHPCPEGAPNRRGVHCINEDVWPNVAFFTVDLDMGDRLVSLVACVLIRDVQPGDFFRVRYSEDYQVVRDVRGYTVEARAGLVAPAALDVDKTCPLWVRDQVLRSFGSENVQHLFHLGGVIEYDDEQWGEDDATWQPQGAFHERMKATQSPAGGDISMPLRRRRKLPGQAALAPEASAELPQAKQPEQQLMRRAPKPACARPLLQSPQPSRATAPAPPTHAAAPGSSFAFLATTEHWSGGSSANSSIARPSPRSSRQAEVLLHCRSGPHGSTRSMPCGVAMPCGISPAEYALRGMP